MDNGLYVIGRGERSLTQTESKWLDLADLTDRHAVRLTGTACCVEPLSGFFWGNVGLYFGRCGRLQNTFSLERATTVFSVFESEFSIPISYGILGKQELTSSEYENLAVSDSLAGDRFAI